MPRKMLLVDGSNHAFRVHFALPPMHNSKGFPTRALYGFTTLLAQITREHEPDYVAFAFDDGDSFRNAMYPDYKGHRPDMPEDLAAQWPEFPKLVEAFGVRSLTAPGFEADDILGTLARQFAGPDLKVWIVTGDHDFYQLVDDDIRILDLMKDEDIGTAEVIARLGIGPDRVVDMKGLAGDTSDNIPGVPGVGEKTAVKYLLKYGSFDAVLANADDIGGKKGQAVKDNAEQARLSHALATIRLDLDIGLSLEDLAPRGLQEDTLAALFDEWDFSKVARKLMPSRKSAGMKVGRIVRTEAELDAVVAGARAEGKIILRFDMADEGTGPIGGAAIFAGDDLAYVPFADRDDLPLKSEVARKKLGELLADPSVKKTVHDAKRTIARGNAEGFVLAGLAGDARLLDYAVAAHERSHGLADLAQRHLGHVLTGEGVSQLGLFGLSLDEQAAAPCEAAQVIRQVEDRLLPRLDDASRFVYEKIELPLAFVIAEVEATGVRLDPSRIDGIRIDLGGRMAEIEAVAHRLAGRTFNLNSRHDVSAVLFESGAFTPTKKVKDGWSTDSSVLEKLADAGNLPAVILDYRHLQKLKGTYLDKLPGYVGKDGRIHTTLNQTGAATGRLSSQDPNLQNIPIRTFEGRRIRDCFVPEEGHVLLSCDYSQIEIRILAHLSGEPALIASFRAGEDIHKRTASEVFGVPVAEVTFEQRNTAKAINFGLLYGMSSFRLAGDLQIEQKEAERYVREYFERLPRVAAWLEETKVEARKNGWVASEYGRRRVIPTLHAPNYNDRMTAEREAVNTRVQATAADIIKVAMVRVRDRLFREGLATRMILQVHDELLLESPIAEVEAARKVVTEEMRASAELSVPLEVTSATGMTWNEAHG